MSKKEIKWFELGPVESFPKEEITAAELPNGASIAIYNVENEFYASFDQCSHGKASFVEEGEIAGHTLECGWHFGTFDVRTGEALTLPCRNPLMTFTTKVEGGKLFINPRKNKPQSQVKED